MKGPSSSFTGGIMRKLLLLCAATLAACGSSSEPPAPTYGVVGSAAGFDQAPSCVLNASNTVGASVAVVDLTGYASPTACSSMTDNKVPLSSYAAAIVIVRAAFAAAAPVPAPGLVAETYPFFDLATIAQGKIPPFDTGGNAAFFTGGFFGCGAAAGTASPVKFASGSVTVTSVSGAQIAGTVSAKLVGGGTLTGSFTADLCAGAPAIDVCTAIQTLSLSLPPPACG